ncbi:SpoIIE family protein phosphatase [Georgenia sunbinii]|uniref:ATP-binding SpoIIE family protein phosphatase n=1 Tax=Georgenia sunbinii TaxID=3117728 RepID=UPI003D9C4E1B
MVSPRPGPGDPPTVVDPAVAHVLDALPDPVVVLDIDIDAPDEPWEVVWAGRALVATTGYDAAALREMPADVLADAVGTDRAALVAAFRREQAFSHVRAVRRRDGSTFRATVSYAPLGPGGGGRRRWLTTIRDASHELASAVLAEERSAVEERARRALSLVAKVSDILADAESVRTLADIAQLLVRRAVGWAAFYADGGPLQQIVELGGASGGSGERRTARDPGEDDPVSALLAETRMRTVVLDREAVLSGTRTEELLGAVALDASFPGDWEELWLVPVLGRESVLGLLAVVPVDRSARGASQAGADATPALTAPELRVLLELVARRVGMAMDNIQLYEREHRLAETLQHAMLPEQGAVEGLDVWSYYAPNSEHAQVGGDWYDVLNVGDGQVAVVVGDVVGHDVEAAASMGQLRSVVRAYAAEFIDPGTVLGRVDRLVAGMRIARPASFVYAVLSPGDDGGWEVAYTRAGHLPPMLVRAGQVRQLDGAGGMLVGFGERPRHTARTVVEPGDVLLFYTDGLVERRDRTMRDGVQRLAEVAADIVAPDAAGVGEEVLLRLADAPEDDIAVVVVRIPDVLGDLARAWTGPRQRRWQMPADPQTIGRARKLVLRTCAAWGLEDTAAVELVVSELVSNAVMHGWGRVDLRLQDTGDGLRIEVEDANPAPPVQRDGRVGRVGGFGLHIIARLADWGWRPTATGKVVWARVGAHKPWESRAAEA